MDSYLNYLEDHQSESWRVQDALTRQLESPSTIGRKSKVSTSHTAAILQALEAHQWAIGEGAGAWRKYRQT